MTEIKYTLNADKPKETRKQREKTLRWTSNDERMLLQLGTSNLSSKWTKISEIIKKFSPGQCLYRFKQLKNKKPELFQKYQQNSSDFLFVSQEVRNHFESVIKNSNFKIEKIKNESILKLKRKRGINFKK
jgi:hypothetical protein